MSNTNDPTHPEWRQRCQAAFFETNPVKLLERIADARNAVLDRIEDGFTKSQDGEQVALREALSTLDSLRRITERQSWRSVKGQLILAKKNYRPINGKPDIKRLCLKPTGRRCRNVFKRRYLKSTTGVWRNRTTTTEPLKREKLWLTP